MVIACGGCYNRSETFLSLQLAQVMKVNNSILGYITMTAAVSNETERNIQSSGLWELIFSEGHRRINSFLPIL
jgi:hypothetical protein